MELINRLMLPGLALLMVACVWIVCVSLARYDKRRAAEEGADAQGDDGYRDRTDAPGRR